MDGNRSGEDFKAGVAPVIDVVTDQGESRYVLKNEAENALYWLFRRKIISPEQLAAGERLREDYTFAQLEKRLTADWEREIELLIRGRSGFGFITDEALAAKLRFFKAVDAVGPELAGMLVEVCCLSAGIEQAERRLALPVRSGKVVLGLALTRLARHYGMIKPEGPTHERPASRHWGLPGYKPRGGQAD